MGLFKRKKSQLTPLSQRPGFADVNPAIGKIVTNYRIAEYYHKAPRLIDITALKSAAMVVTIPAIEIPGPPNPNTDPAGYLRSIHAVRQRSKIVLEKARNNQLTHFNVDLTKFQDTADYVVSIIKVCGTQARNETLTSIARL